MSQATGVLKFNINTFLNSQGFQQFKQGITQSTNLAKKFQQQVGNHLSKNISSGLNLVNSTLGQMVLGYFTVTGLVNQYNKAVESANYQLEQEQKLYTTLRAQKFRDEQIKSIIDYTGELQNLGVVGDEVTISGAQQLATFRMKEESIKSLLPAMQDMLVKERGLNGTGEDMKGIASTFAKAMNGQTMILKRNGIVLSEREEQLMKVGTEEQKVALLTEAVRRSIGEQNKEILKTPEGKITSAKNRIGDLYEVWGMSIRDTRAKFWEFVAENADGIQDIITRVFKGGASFVDTFMGVFRDIKKGFNALPDSAKNGLKGIGALALAYEFPILALAFAAEDVFAAFQGKDSFTEGAINALLKFTGTDYRFSDLRNDINQFWEEITNPADRADKEISNVNFALQETIEFLKAGFGLLQMVISASGVVGNMGKYAFNWLTKDKETADREWNDSWSVNVFKGGWDTLTASSEKMLVELPNRRRIAGANEAQREYEAQLYQAHKNKSSYAPYTPDILDKIPSKQNEAFLNDLKNLNAQKDFSIKQYPMSNQSINNNPVYNLSFTINEANNSEQTTKAIEQVIKKVEKEKELSLKARVGMQFAN